MALLLGDDKPVEQVVEMQDGLIVLVIEACEVEPRIAGIQLCKRLQHGVGGGDQLRVAAAGRSIAAGVLVGQRELSIRRNPQRAQALSIDQGAVGRLVSAVAIGVELEQRGDLGADLRSCSAGDRGSCRLVGSVGEQQGARRNAAQRLCLAGKVGAVGLDRGELLSQRAGDQLRSAAVAAGAASEV